MLHLNGIKKSYCVEKIILFYRFLSQRHNLVNLFLDIFMITQEFKSDKKFFDDLNFPYGIDRSGDFTRQQADILLNCGCTLQALEAGTLAPVTATQKEFVLMIEGQKAPESEIEKVWAKYKTVIGSKGRILGLNSGPDKTSHAEPYVEDLE
jgi:uncharacterized protein YifE (UPF0438 family)